MPERSEVVVTLVGDADFVRRLTALTVSKSLRISDQEARSPGSERRINLAYSILSNPTGMVDRFAWAVACKSVVQDAYLEGQAAVPPTKLSDDVLEDAIMGVWGALAGGTG